MVLKVSGIVFTMVGVVLLLVCGFSYRNTSRFVRNSARATGRVVRFERRTSTNSNSRGRLLFAPVIEFETARGEKVQFVSSTASADPGHMVGDAVDVLYDEAAPQRAAVNTFWSLWFLPLFLGGMGTVFTIIGGILVLLFLKEARSRPNLSA